MKIIFDVCYNFMPATVAAITFEDYTSNKIVNKYMTSYHIPAEEYESGQFYKRELPCLQKLWNGIPYKVKNEIDTVIVDGLYDLWDGRPGLGHHFRDWLLSEGYNVEVIGIAKKKFKNIFPTITDVVRGNATTPIHVNGSDKTKDYGALVKSMYGSYRIPWIVKEVDKLSRCE